MATKRTKSVAKPAPSNPAVYFHSLTIENFRSFGKAQTLNLAQEDDTPAMWTIILGDNGVGKTTILQCLAALQPVYFSDQDRITELMFMYSPEYRKFYQNIESQHRRNPRLRINLFDDSNIHIDQHIESRVYSGGVSGVLRFPVVRWEPSDVKVQLTCYGYGAARRMGDTSLSEQRNQDYSGSLFLEDAAVLNAEEWLLQADYATSRASAQEKARKRRDKIITLLTDLLPDISEIRFTLQDEFTFTPRVEFKTPYGWVKLNDLSLGYRTLMAWMVDLASRMFERYPDSDDPLAEPAIVLVDEIDLHLHPRWQRSLVSYLSERFPRTQFIVTAHSPLVVQSAPDANIVLVRREGDHAVIDNDIETIENWRVDQVLTSDLFGLESARPPQLDGALAERQRLLSKPTLTKADRRRLEEVEATIGQLPTGDTPDDITAMDVIRRAASILNGQQDQA